MKEMRKDERRTEGSTEGKKGTGLTSHKMKNIVAGPKDILVCTLAWFEILRMC